MENKRKMSYYLMYYTLYIPLFIIALFPFRILYIFSDILYLIVYYLLRYRRNVTAKNLSESFPFKNPKELKKLEKKFYHHLCDYFVETIKLLHISDREIQKRMIFKNKELLDSALDSNQSAILCMGHYCNWEWVTSLNLSFNKDEKLCQVYKSLSNNVINDFFLKLRARFKSEGIDKNKIFREIIRRRQNDQKLLIGFIADQSPSLSNIHYWVSFLNHDTPVFVGIEKIAKQTNFAVLYLDITKVKRGFYESEIKLITTIPKQEEDFFITKTYFSELEHTIQRAPEYWLWSHRRWKYKDQQEVDHLLNRKK